MDTNQMFAFMDILMIGAGLYLLYSWYILMFKGEIREGVLIQSGLGRKCKDIEGYKKYIGPKLLAFTVCAIIAGGIGLYSDYVKPINSYVYLALTGVFFVALIFFIRASKKAQDMFF